MSDPGPSPAAAGTHAPGSTGTHTPENTDTPAPGGSRAPELRGAAGDAGADRNGADAPRTAPSGGPAASAAGAPPERADRIRAGLLITLILGSLTALPALSMDMYLPALPDVGTTLGSPATQVQLTLTTCLLGLAVGQLVVGPMSDRFGRRGPLLLGMAGYVLASAACAVAPDIHTLTAFRLVQGLTGAAGIVIARAIVRDLFDGLAMARFFSTLMLVSGIAPILAPVLGGQVLRFTDWRGVFLVLTALGIALLLVVARRLPETLAPEKRHAGGLSETLRTVRGLLADRVFSGYLLTGSFLFAALFAYVAASPFVVQEIYGASPQAFGILFMVNSIGLVATGQVNGRLLVGRVPLDRVIAVGLVLVLAASVALLLMTAGAFGEVGLVPVAAGLFVLMSAMALVLPNTNSQALMRTPHAAGSASALLGTAAFLVGAVASPMVGVAGEETAVPMAIVQLVTTAVAGACFVLMCRPQRTAGPART